MLCGQGGAGKSTFSRKLAEQCPGQVKICSMDEIVIEKEGKKIDIPQFVSNIQAALDNKENEYVIIDFAFDSPVSRGIIMYRLNFNSPTNFVTISLRPPVEKIIEWQENRQKKKCGEMTRQQIIGTVRVYCGFQPPNKHEFTLLGFNSIQTLMLDSSSEEDCQKIYKQLFNTKR